jgi:hypothetical protein
MNLKTHFISILILLGLVNNSLAQDYNPYQAEFHQAYLAYPSLPNGILEAVSFTQTRFTDLHHTEHGCVGMPLAEGVMGLFGHGHGYFNENKATIASLSGIPINQMGSPQADIMAYAAAFDNLISSNNIQVGDYSGYESILRSLSEIPERWKPG